MKKLFKKKRENGAIAVMTALMLTVLLGFTALSIDIGLHYYLGARLQNAVDSAAVAIGQKLESDQSELDKTAYDYLAKNGYDNKNGEYKDRVSADIEFIGVQNLPYFLHRSHTGRRAHPRSVKSVFFAMVFQTVNVGRAVRHPHLADLFTGIVLNDVFFYHI